MSSDKIQAFKDATQKKINNVLEDFAAGKLNREQLYAMYERYNAQMRFVEESNHAVINIPTTSEAGTATRFVRDQFMGRVVGILIYAQGLQKKVEVLGEFDLPQEKLNVLIKEIIAFARAEKPLKRNVRHIQERRWVLITGRDHTTVITLFENRPSKLQILELERMHTDFETANAAFLTSSDWEVDQLAIPFYELMKRHIKR